jgi:glucuronate isomerase
MFTTSPSLAQRIERMIGETPVIDPHSHLHGDRPAAPDLAALLLDGPGVRAELLAVGMPAADLDAALPPEERVRRALPFLKRMRNTATAWCAFRILRDLHDLHEGELTEGNLGDVAERVAAAGRDPSWARAVLRDRSNIRAVVTESGSRGDATADLTDAVFHRLEIPGGFGSPGALAATLGAVPAGAAALDRAVRDWLDRALAGPVRFACLALPGKDHVGAPDGPALDAALRRAAAGAELADAEAAAIARGVLWSLLGWHHDAGRALQLAVSAGSLFHPGPLRTILEAFPNARFDLMLASASDAAAATAAELCRRWPHVSNSGYGFPALDPGAIERIAALRFQVAPMAKFAGFLGDADTVEWAYGRYVLVRKAVAAALAGLVERGFYEEDELPPMLRQVLHDTPRDLYGLHAAS